MNYYPEISLASMSDEKLRTPKGISIWHITSFFSVRFPNVSFHPFFVLEFHVAMFALDQSFIFFFFPSFEEI
jgi:hypothetical protein